MLPMINLSRDIHSLTEFKRNTTEFLQRIKQTKHPLVLTVNGKAELVVQDAESYQALLEAAELVETLKGIKRGLEQMQQGKGRKAEDFFSELFDKLDNPKWAKNIESSQQQTKLIPQLPTATCIYKTEKRQKDRQIFPEYFSVNIAL